ncbi:hypothetical protein ACFCX7_27055 [Streptomyces microflavus]|uniref:hypothetical protein n=1 Tax=Streptomyces microflavus TaxID=1919 RepID=UPI0035D7B517
MKAFVSELRTVFEGLEISVRQYAARHHYDDGSVSRFLSGRRLPQWTFVEKLLEESAVNDEVRAHLRTLYDDAVKIAKPGVAHRLHDRIAVLQADLDSARVHEQVLERAVHEREQRISELQGELALEQARRSQDQLRHAGELAVRDAEIAALRGEVASLRRELEAVHARIAELEEDAREVEAELDTAEAAEGDAEQTGSGTGTVMVPSDRLGPLRTGLSGLLMMIREASAGPYIAEAWGPAGDRLIAILEKMPEGQVPVLDLERLADMIQMALAQVELKTSKSRPVSDLMGRRSPAVAMADFTAATLCLYLAVLHQARGDLELVQQYQRKAGDHFHRGYPAFMGKPAASGSKWNYRTGSTSYVSDSDKLIHALQTHEVKATFELIQEHLTQPTGTGGAEPPPQRALEP